MGLRSQILASASAVEPEIKGASATGCRLYCCFLTLEDVGSNSFDGVRVLRCFPEEHEFPAAAGDSPCTLSCPAFARRQDGTRRGLIRAGKCFPTSNFFSRSWRKQN